jgi:hypothetical protein
MTPREHQAALGEVCPMPVNQWRAIKGLVYVLIMGVVATVAIVEQQVFVPIAFILAAMLIFGIEVKEIQIADYISITFSGGVEGEGVGIKEEDSQEDKTEQEE